MPSLGRRLKPANLNYLDMGIIIRFLLIGVLIGIIVIIVKALLKPNAHEKCGRCHGHGYWDTSHGRQTCDDCNGTGRKVKEGYTRQ